MSARCRRGADEVQCTTGNEVQTRVQVYRPAPLHLPADSQTELHAATHQKRCASCDRLKDDVRPVLTKMHGQRLLCSDCEDFCRSRGWLIRSYTPPPAA